MNVGCSCHKYECAHSKELAEPQGAFFEHCQSLKFTRNIDSVFYG